jgi:acetyl esterase/lipase
VEALGRETLDETRAFNAYLAELLATHPPVEVVGAAAARAARRKGRSFWPPPVFLEEARDVTIAGRGGEIRLHVVAPPGEPRGIYLHVHGGGWALGAADLQDPLLAALAEETGLAVASVDYRLAPEHPYPAGPEDCEYAALWAVREGRRVLGTGETLAIGGESAGAHLAVLTLLRLRDAHGVAVADEFARANLVFGVYDLTGTPSRLLWDGRNLILSSSTMAWFADQFVPGLDFEARRAGEISPLYADLAALPPALFSVGTLDPLLDDSLFMAARWSAAGNGAELRVWQDGAHGFTAFPLEIARRCLREQFEFLGR